MKKMTLSMKVALDNSIDRKFFISNDLGFILKVIVDNTSDDYVYEVLKNVLNNREVI